MRIGTGRGILVYGRGDERLQLVAHCVIARQNEWLLLQKPRRGWWVAPGGKVEHGEGLTAAVVREVQEETGLTIVNPQLCAVSTITLWDEDTCIDHWMLFTYYADKSEGEPLAHSEEGTLRLWDPAQLSQLPMAEGDRHIFEYILQSKRLGCPDSSNLFAGSFQYTAEYELISWSRDV